MGENEKPFACSNSECSMTFTNEDHLTIHQKKHDMSLSLEINSKSGYVADQTPTPTRFIRNCEEVGLFQDLQSVNPFEETFRKAIDSVKTGHLSIPDTNTDDTLHTPQIYPPLEETRPTNFLINRIPSIDENLLITSESQETLENKNEAGPDHKNEFNLSEINKNSLFYRRLHSKSVSVEDKYTSVDDKFSVDNKLISVGDKLIIVDDRRNSVEDKGERYISVEHEKSVGRLFFNSENKNCIERRFISVDGKRTSVDDGFISAEDKGSSVEERFINVENKVVKNKENCARDSFISIQNTSVGNTNFKNTSADFKCVKDTSITIVDDRFCVDSAASVAEKCVSVDVDKVTDIKTKIKNALKNKTLEKSVLIPQINVFSPENECSSVSVGFSSARKRTRSPQVVQDGAQKKTSVESDFLENRRAINRAAQSRSRQRKKNWIGNMEKSMEQLKLANESLYMENNSLKSEIEILKKIVLQHEKCIKEKDPLIGEHLQRLTKTTHVTCQNATAVKRSSFVKNKFVPITPQISKPTSPPNIVTIIPTVIGTKQNAQIVPVTPIAILPASSNISSVSIGQIAYIQTNKTQTVNAQSVNVMKTVERSTKRLQISKK